MVCYEPNFLHSNELPVALDHTIANSISTHFHFADHSAQCDIVTADIVEQLIAEIGKIKTQLGNTELQLYEANEKIADIIENVCEHSALPAHITLNINSLVTCSTAI